jgi:hypothetical protein
MKRRENFELYSQKAPAGQVYLYALFDLQDSNQDWRYVGQTKQNMGQHYGDFFKTSARGAKRPVTAWLEEFYPVRPGLEFIELAPEEDKFVREQHWVSWALAEGFALLNRLRRNGT